MNDPNNRYRSRFVASALAGLTLASTAGAQAQPAASPPAAPAPPPPPNGPPEMSPAPPPESIDHGALELQRGEVELRQFNNQVLLLTRDAALAMSRGSNDARSGCPMQLGPFSPDSDGFVTSATLYSEVSVEASEQRGEPVCAYFVTSYPQPPPAFLGRRLVAEHGIVRAGLVERAGWGAA